jgi:hypothetical protein
MYGSKNGEVMEVRVMKESGTVVSMLSPNAGSTPVQEKYSDGSPSAKYQSWGTDNQQPRNWRIKIEKSTTAYPLIQKICEIIFGKGLVYWFEEKDASGNIKQNFTSNAEVDQFILDNDIEVFLQQRIMDYKFSGNMFCEFILDNGMNKIVNLNHLEAEFSRLGQLNEKTQKFDLLKYTGDWSKESSAVDIPYLNRQDKSKDFIRSTFNKGKNKKFAFQSYMPSPGRTIYAFPSHGAIFRDNGWLDFSNSVPEIMNSINKNAMDLKYHIRIPYSYWETVNPNWDNLKEPEQTAFIDEKLKTMNDWLKGGSNAGKTFISHFATDFVTGKPLAGWEVIVLDDKTKKDAYITSIQEADIQIARALGADTSISGIQTGAGKMGAGSGSDKRVGMDNQVGTSYAAVLHIMEPLRIVAMYNDWPANIKFGFMHELPTTLNEDLSGIKTQI